MMPPVERLDFDAEAHVYRYDGVRVLSVTQVLVGAGMIDTRFYTPESRKLGAYVHAATALDDTHELDEASLDPRIVPYLAAWRKFRDGQNAEIVSVERMVYSPIWDYAGTCDRVLRQNDREYVVDIKTGSPAAWHPLQTAGYAMALGLFARMAVYLRDDESFRVVEHHDQLRDEAVFISALQVHKWRQKNHVNGPSSD